MAGHNDTSTIAFGESWQVLGPFQIGTREIPWGADPLEAWGGISRLPYNKTASFPSSLAPNASVSWNDLTAEVTTRHLELDQATVRLPIKFAHVDWAMLHTVYGWAALQYQCWIRGVLHVPSRPSARVTLDLDGLAEYRIDGKPFFGGDLFSFHRATEVLDLSPGDHVLEVRAVRDVRAMGASVMPPTFEVAITAKLVAQSLAIDGAQDILPDFVHGHPSTPYASITVTNLLDESILVERIESLQPGLSLSLLQQPVLVHSRQARPIQFQLTSRASVGQEQQLDLRIHYSGEVGTVPAISGDRARRSQAVRDHAMNLTHAESGAFHRITYLHPAGIVSSSLLLPPKTLSEQTEFDDRRYPALVYLHGAGVDPNGQMLRHSLDHVADLPYWFLIPSGTTSWAADDWHHWGFSDAVAAVQTLSKWASHHKWTGPGILADRFVCIGHSNGGQGTYYAASHWPDLVTAAAPVSGYVSIQDYVPYVMRGEVDAERSSLIHAALQNYHHGLLAPNMADTPLFIQHGSVDDNVPSFHSRKMSAILEGIAPANVNFKEIPDAEHWFEGVMETPALRHFYKTVSNQSAARSEPASWQMLVVSPSETGSKFGLRVLQLQTYGRIASVSVTSVGPESLTWRLRTYNVKALSLSQAWSGRTIIIDGESTYIARPGPCTLQVDNQGQWSAADITTDGVAARLGSGISAILNTAGAFCIVYEHLSAQDAALSIAKNLYQYLAADAVVQQGDSAQASCDGNVISVSIGSRELSKEMSRFPIVIEEQSIRVRTKAGRTHTYSANEYGSLGAVYLYPKDGKLALHVWGSDAAGLGLAARLSPSFTGVGVPDFVILGSAAQARGVLGTLAMGFYDSEWNLSSASFVS